VFWGVSLAVFLVLGFFAGTGSGLPCTQYEDEFEPNPLAQPAALSPPLRWDGMVQNSSILPHLRRISLSAMQFCTKDGDALTGEDAFSFQVACLNASAPFAILDAAVHFIHFQVELGLDLYMVGNDGSLSLLGTSNGTHDISHVSARVRLNTSANTRFVVRIFADEVRGSDALHARSRLAGANCVLWTSWSE
jgi:hypothetical protein